MDDDILQEFLAESWENLGQLDTEIVLLEKEPNNSDLIASIFRTIHTIKGTCGFIGLTNLGSVAHSAENVLGKMRDRELAVTPGAISLVLEAIDAIKKLLEGLEATSEEPKTDYSMLNSMLDALAAGASDQPSESIAPEISETITATEVEEVTAVAEPAEQPVAPITEQIVVEQPVAEQQIAAELIASPVVEQPAAPPVVEKVPDSVASIEEPAVETSRKSVADLSIRVNVDVLERLMNLVGELVLTRNQLLQLSRGDEESKYAAPITHLNRVTTDLQEGVMKTRMQPIGNAWNKLPRLIRDLEQLTGKQIELEMTGAETELDRTVLDAIKDPLTHMIRNSADHGLETPDERVAVGKPEVGMIHLDAFHEGGHVIIQVIDDGRGINAEKVLAKAIDRGLVSEADAAKMSQSELLQLIFHPGFSTAEKISSISGRGVGMDVVRAAIERIGGTVDLSSTHGAGTKIRIKIPLTLAIISALVVESGGESFAIPQLGVVELVRLSSEDRERIERIHDKEVFRLRDRLLPLVYLNEVLGLDDTTTDDNEHQDVNIVVVQVGEDQFGLIVSKVFDTEEIVVKPVGRLLKDLTVYQGTTILGDGRVIMILDVTGIAAESGGLQRGAIQHHYGNDVEFDHSQRATSMLLFRAGESTVMAVPLSLVARLEETHSHEIENSGTGMVMQYRGSLLPLQYVSGHGPVGERPDPQPVIVFTEGDRSMGLLVDEILDIREERLIIERQSSQAGVLGTAIINGNATDVIDTQYYVTQATPNWFDGPSGSEDIHVLVVDDSLFFRQLVTTAIESEGMRVTSFEKPHVALDQLSRSEHQYDIIIADLKMPGMDGFEFAKQVKSHSSCAETPMIALTGLEPARVESAAMEAGYTRLLKKFNARELMSVIQQLQPVSSDMFTSVGGQK
ncbi:hybrid sensor histidine kinase/response regulator [Calycomorphotria hydatis]|uniref:histidine kinase n=1 Tax=Calycomorphotria hydatis TaxID=2528027 RepID=A0A517T7A1_9PLAN|nr:chemotaxis protein CheW [Calycomorphotria hydatis]QDT64253.1 Chemotaxis protein CheA [Calycomorphotria hydatis]